MWDTDYAISFSVHSKSMVGVFGQNLRFFIKKTVGFFKIKLRNATRFRLIRLISYLIR